MSDERKFKLVTFSESVGLSIQLRLNGSVVSTQKSNRKYATKEYILIPPGKEPLIYGLYISSMQKRKPLLKINHSERMLSKQSDLLLYNFLYQISQLLYKKQTKRKALSLFTSFIENNPDFSLGFNEIISRCGRLLLELEEYQLLLSYFENIDVNTVINKKQLYDYLWIKGRVYLNTEKHFEAEQQFLNLLNELEKDGNLSEFWRLNKEEVRALYGFSQSLNAFFSHKDASIGLEYIIEALNGVKNSGNNYLISRVLYLLSSALTLAGEYRKSLASLEYALELINQTKTKDGLYLIYNQIAINHLFLNDLQKAQLNYRKVIENLEPEIQPHSKAGIYYNLANTYKSLGDYSRAYRYFNQSLEIYNKINSAYEVVETLNLMGDINRHEKKFKQAISQHKYSIRYFNKHHKKLYVESILKLGKDYYDISELQLSQNEVRKSIIVNENKNQTVEYSELSKLTAQALEQVFDRSLSQFVIKTANDFDSVLMLAKISLELKDLETLAIYYKRLQKTIPLDALPINIQLDYLLFEMKYLESTGQFTDLDKTAETAFTLINDTRSKIGISDLALIWTNQAKAILNQYSGALISQERFIDIFNFLEKFYAINLREKRLHNADELMADKSWDIQQALDNYVKLERETLLTDNRDKQNQADEAKENFLALNTTGGVLVEKIELDYLSLDEVQAQLGADELLLRYYVNDDNAFVFVIDKQQRHVKSIPDQASLKLMIQAKLKAIKSKGFKHLMVPDKLLSEVLPIDLINEGQYKKLIIIPDGILNLLPFSMLNIGDDGYKPLATTIDVERTYSASDYFATMPKSQNGAQTISVFANPIFLDSARDKKIQAAIAKDNKLWEFVALPNTGVDANNIVEIFPNFDINLLTGGQATNKNFLTAGNRNANIIHIGTHGFFNDKNLENVGIATSIIDENGQLAPGALAMREILYQPFKANLAVISGCETTLGKEINGEGFNSLSRGLLSQGVGSVIGTIWSISDKATPVFMKEFYTNLRDMNGDVSKALNTSKRNFATKNQFRRYRHPYYWAGFVLTSSNRSLSENIFQ